MSEHSWFIILGIPALLASVVILMLNHWLSKNREDYKHQKQKQEDAHKSEIEMTKELYSRLSALRNSIDSAIGRSMINQTEPSRLERVQVLYRDFYNYYSGELLTEDLNSVAEPVFNAISCAKLHYESWLQDSTPEHYCRMIKSKDSVNDLFSKFKVKCKSILSDLPNDSKK